MLSENLRLSEFQHVGLLAVFHLTSLNKAAGGSVDEGVYQSLVDQKQLGERLHAL